MDEGKGVSVKEAARLAYEQEELQWLEDKMSETDHNDSINGVPSMMLLAYISILLSPVGKISGCQELTCICPFWFLFTRVFFHLRFGEMRVEWMVDG